MKVLLIKYIGKIMKSIKLSIILMLSLFLMTQGANATRITCTWPNGDHFDLSHPDEEFINQMLDSCYSTGGTYTISNATISDSP